METETIVQAIILGFIEGLTEFIPVSSTGHILLAGEFLGFSSEGKVFEIVIQLGAILAIISVYFARLWNLFITLPSSATSRRFVAGIVLAFLPAAFAGVLLHGFIKEVLFETPVLICVSLIVGGLILLWIDRLPLTPRYTDVTEYPLSLCLKIGLCQMLALFPAPPAAAQPSRVLCLWVRTSVRPRSSHSSWPCPPCSAPWCSTCTKTAMC
jgi:undecaprenyl-diphosphatase